MIAKLGEIAMFSSGGTPSRAKPGYYTGRIPWITGADIGEGGEVAARSFITPDAVAGSATTVAPAGTVLLVTRTSVGKVGVPDQDTAFSQDITAIHHDQTRLDRDYLVQYLRSQERYFSSRARGATIKGVTRETVAQLEVPLPDLDEQRRIARMLSKTGDLRCKRSEVLARLDELGRSSFQHMFGRCESLVTLGDVIQEGPTNGLYRPSSDYGSGTPILRIDGFDHGFVKDAPWKRVRITQKELDRYSLAVGDVVINRVNALSHLGKSVLIDHLAEPSVYESNMMRVRLDDSKVDRHFVAAWLQGPSARQQILGKAKKSINQASINQGDVRSLEMPLPPLALQHTFARLLLRINEQRAVMRSALACTEHLLASLQTDCFHREL